MAAVVAAMAWSGGAAAQTIQWIESPAQAQAAWQADKKPVVLFFYTHQTRPSNQLRVETLENPEVKARLANFVCVALDQRMYGDLGKKFNLVRVPTVIFLDEYGRELDRAAGFKSPEDFAIYLDRITHAYTAMHAGPSGGRVAAFRNAAIDIGKPGPKTQPISFSYTGTRIGRVNVVGDFNDWRTDANPLVRGQGNDWTMTAHLPPGVYEYLFLVDGATYLPDPRNPLKKTNPYGGTNSVMLVGNPVTSPVIMGNSVYFFLYDATAKEIKVAGSFKNWEEFTMYRKPNEPGMWGVRYDNMPKGTHQYKYVIDGNWVVDAENYILVTDAEGNTNSSFTIK